MEIKIKPDIITKDYEIGVIIARMQVHELHEAHLGLINMVLKNHKKVIIFLGVPRIGNTPKNPLGFSERAGMINQVAPDAIIIPIQDRRNNEEWSKEIDYQISLTQTGKPLLYGGRDSFIPFYKGKHKTVELVTDVFYSGTNIRKDVSYEVLSSADFRAGVIYSTFQMRPTSYQTVDIAPINSDGKILLGKKPGEDDWRFIGGFVDPSDKSLEDAAKREFHEEAGSGELGNLSYLGSFRIDDWRYRHEESKIMTSFYSAPFLFGNIEPNDDIEAVGWFTIDEIYSQVKIMPEHKNLMDTLLMFLRNRRLHLDKEL